MNFIWYRMVGGFIGLGPNHTFECRIRFAIGVGVYMAFLAAVKQFPLIEICDVFFSTILLAYAGRLIAHSEYQSVASFKNGLMMGLIGTVRLALILTPYALLYQLNWFALSISLMGLFQGFAYYSGLKYLDGADSGIYYRNYASQYQIHRGVKLPDEDPASFLDQGAVGGGEWGELLTGIFVYDLPYKILLLIP